MLFNILKSFTLIGIYQFLKEQEDPISNLTMKACIRMEIKMFIVLKNNLRETTRKLDISLAFSFTGN